jgi:hypothetical protein
LAFQVDVIFRAVSPKIEQNWCSIRTASPNVLLTASRRACDAYAQIHKTSEKYVTLTKLILHPLKDAPTVVSPNRLSALLIYLGSSAIGHFVWEVLQLPLYTIWTEPFRNKAVAVFHCTTGDLLIALCTLVAASFAAANPAWPQGHFWRVAAVTIVFGVGYTIVSEWLNVTIRASWAYSERMPLVSAFGLQIGLSPLLQWVVIPAAVFAITRRLEART